MPEAETYPYCSVRWLMPKMIFVPREVGCSRVLPEMVRVSECSTVFAAAWGAAVPSALAVSGFVGRWYYSCPVLGCKRTWDKQRPSVPHSRMRVQANILQIDQPHPPGVQRHHFEHTRWCFAL